jgi:hypothetical protein
MSSWNSGTPGVGGGDGDDQTISWPCRLGAVGQVFGAGEEEGALGAVRMGEEPSEGKNRGSAFFSTALPLPLLARRFDLALLFAVAVVEIGFEEIGCGFKEFGFGFEEFGFEFDVATK